MIDFSFRTLALNLVTKLVKDHAEVAVPGFAASLAEFFSNWTNIVPTKSNAKTALAVMQWISVIFVQSPRFDCCELLFNS